ncbi:MAG TPA: hypothetical protein VFZ09_01240 [Archangium sp.]|uniref:hypothetical protein n=1 Tax=Archangium sp. TaxID=1872627 RepID=UPI002E30C7F1|nr:hypothetical protein [Archangium sp.]HEX5744833.1 hypothetical protein [Archangium sp.]
MDVAENGTTATVAVAAVSPADRAPVEPAQANAVAPRNPEAFEALKRDVADAGTVTPRNPAAFEALGQVEGPALEDKQVPNAPPAARMEEGSWVPSPSAAAVREARARMRKGRPPARGTERSRRTLATKLKSLESAIQRYEYYRSDEYREDADAAFLEAVLFAEAADQTARLPGELLAHARRLRLLTEVGTKVRAEPAPRQPPERGAPHEPAVAAHGAQPASPATPAVPSAPQSAAVPQPAPTPPPPMAMGVPVERLKQYAVPAAILAQVVCGMAKRPGFDPTEKLDLVYLRNTPFQFEVKGLPAERLGELLMAEMAMSLAPKSEAGSPMARRLELAALGAILLGPTLKAKAVDALEAAAGAGAKLRARLKAKRAGGL